MEPDEMHVCVLRVEGEVETLSIIVRSCSRQLPRKLPLTVKEEVQPPF